MKSNCLIDLHGGGYRGNILPLTVVEEGFEDSILGLAKAAGLSLLWKVSSSSGVSQRAALDQGIKALTVEAGGDGRCYEESVEAMVKSVLNIMKHLEMIDGPPELPTGWTVVKGDFLHCMKGGFFRYLKGLGEKVEKGAIIGCITDLHGEEIEKVLAPYDGIIIWLRTYPSIRPGDETFIVGEVVETI